MQILRTVIVKKKDVLAVLPVMAPFADFKETGFRSTETISIVLVVF